LSEIQRSIRQSDAASKAANTWNSVSCAHPQLAIVSPSDAAARPGDGHNTIEWVTDFSARGLSGDTGGYADVQYVANSDGVWIISEVDIYLSAQALSCSTTDCIAVEQTMLHEFGHSLGLLHPCEAQATAAVPACCPGPANFSDAFCRPRSFQNSQFAFRLDPFCGAFRFEGCPDMLKCAHEDRPSP